MLFKNIYFYKSGKNIYFAQINFRELSKNILHTNLRKLWWILWCGKVPYSNWNASIYDWCLQKTNTGMKFKQNNAFLSNERRSLTRVFLHRKQRLTCKNGLKVITVIIISISYAKKTWEGQKTSTVTMWLQFTRSKLVKEWKLLVTFLMLWLKLLGDWCQSGSFFKW